MHKIKKIINYFILKFKIKKIKGAKIKSINIAKDIEIEEYVQIPKKVRIAENVSIGKCTYLSPNTTIESNVKIGKFCSIAPNVFIAPGQHYTNLITTHPILFDPIWRKMLNIKEDSKYIKNINKHDQKTIIGNDVWIGLNAIIMRGVQIGDGAVIGAGSVVTKNVAPYSIVGGIPAKHIKYRFSEDKINKIKDLKWWNDKQIDINNLYNIKEKNEN